MEKASTTSANSTTICLQSIDPHYSRPLDVHVYSEHSEVGKIVETIWQQSFPDLPCLDARKGGAKPKTSYRQQLKVLILDLYVAWKTDPGLSIGVHLSNTAWHTNSRYNALRLSRKIPSLVHQLAEKGFIELSKGSYAGPGASTNRTARMLAAEPLKKLFREAKFGLEHIGAHPSKEVVVMHDTKGKEVEYEETPETKAMRMDLRSYNRLLDRTFIDIPDQKEQFIERPIKSGPRQGEKTRIPICTLTHTVRRIFNRGRWDNGGRFFGGWWQGVGSEFRTRIHLNGVPTVEVDYQALHVAVLAARKGRDLPDDPYELEPGLIEGMEDVDQRKLVKLLVLMALNAKDRNTACKAFRQDSPRGSRAKSMTNRELLRVLDAFSERHPFLREDLCSDQGIGLMNVDSKIAARVINHFTRRDVPVLCIHDSFLIDYNHSLALKAVMKLAARAEVGRPIATSHNYLGLDEIERDDPERAEDYAGVRRRERCPENLTRQRLFGERVSYFGF